MNIYSDDPLDSDNDGMPDSWEITYGLNPSVYDADNDADNDSLTNIKEFQYNTLPNNSDTDNDGLLDGEEIFQIGEKFQINTYTTGPQRYPHVSSNGNNYFVIWESLREGCWDINGQLFNKNGSKLGSEFLIDIVDFLIFDKFDIESNGTDYLVSWGSSEGYAQFFDNNGNNIGTKFPITDGISAPDIASDGNNFFVSWQTWEQDGSWDGLSGLLLDNEGNTFSDTFQINTYTNKSQTGPVISSNGSNYFAVWSSDEQDGYANGVYGQMFDNEGTKIGLEFQINTYTTLSQTCPCIASDGNNYFVVWQSIQHDGYEIYGKIFDNEGDIIHEEFRINTTTDSDQTFPSIAYNGYNYLVTWRDSMPRSSPKIDAIYAQLYDRRFKKIGEEFQIAIYEISYDNGIHPSGHPTLASDGKNYFVTWMTDRSDGDNYGIYGKIIKPGFPTNPLLSDTDSDGLNDSEEIFGSQYLTDPSNPDTDGDGLLDGWEIDNNFNPLNDDSQGDFDNDGLSNGDEVTYGTSVIHPDTDGDGLLDGEEVFQMGEEFQINTYTTGSQFYPDIISNGDNYLVTWIDFGNYIDYYILKGQFFDDLGNKIGSEFQIVSYPRSLYMYMKNTASNSENHFIAYSGFESDNEADITNGHLIDLNGNIINSEIQIATSNNPFSSYDPNVISNGDNYFVVWTKSVDPDANIFAQLFDNEGNKTGDSFQINTYTTSSQSAPSIASDGTNYFVTWSSNEQDGNSHGIYGQLLDNEGNKINSEFQINSYTTEYQIDSSVAFNGINYLVAWQSYYQDGDRLGIYGQIFNNTGNSIGNEFQINTYTSSDQENVFITSNGKNFFVIWQSRVQDGHNEGLFGQLYDSIGKKINHEFQINSFTTGNQYYPSIANNGTTYLAVWTSETQDGDEAGIYGKIIKPGSNSNPLLFDTDNDGLSDAEEFNNSQYPTNPSNPDTDNDGLLDGWEIDNNFNPLNDDSQDDFDNDGLSNAEELIYNTSVIDPDTDNDGMPDGWEVNNDLNPLLDDADNDYDYDGLSNIEEYQNGTLANNSDSDSDGMNDGDEVYVGMEPDNSDSLFALQNITLHDDLNCTTVNWFGSVASPDIEYKILWSDYPWNEWNEVELDNDDIENDDGIRLWIDEGDNDADPPRPQPTNSSNRFYKVIVE